MILGLTTDYVRVVPYDHNWKTVFEETKTELMACLHEYDVHIEHVGSTSIEGCPSKPIIDIFIGVMDIQTAEKVIPLLEEAGYIHSSIDIPDEIYFKKKNAEGLTTHHIHVSVEGGKNWQNQVLLRDYLRENPETLDKYIKLKIHLAALYPYDRTAYSKGKDLFIKKTINTALEERKG